MTPNPHNTKTDAADAVNAIAAYLDAEADKTPRARVRARTLRIAASNVRAGLWREDDGR